MDLDALDIVSIAISVVIVSYMLMESLFVQRRAVTSYAVIRIFTSIAVAVAAGAITGQWAIAAVFLAIGAFRLRTTRPEGGS